MVHQATKVEQQLKRKGQIRRSTTTSNPQNWKSNIKKEGTSSSKEVAADTKGKNTTTTPSQVVSTNRAIKCFKCQGLGHIASQCPTKRIMIVEEVEDEDKGAEEHEKVCDEEEAQIRSGELLMMKRLLEAVVKEEETTQRENIFHSRCLIQGKVCSLIIDGGSCTNVASTRLVSKLQLETKPHPKPYKLQWLVNDVEMIVDEQVEISFSIGKYEDVVVCDVVPMEASHVLLGRPWQFDKKASHEGQHLFFCSSWKTNCIGSFELK